MEATLKICAFADDEVGYIAIASAAPGLFGTGRTPGQASSDLLCRFLGSLDDIPHPPAPDSELAAVLDVQLSVVPFAED